MSETSAWNGQILGECVSLAVCEDSATGTVITAAKSGLAESLVYPDQLARSWQPTVQRNLSATTRPKTIGQCTTCSSGRKIATALRCYGRSRAVADSGMLGSSTNACVWSGMESTRRKSLDQLIVAYGGCGLSGMDVAGLNVPIQQGKMPADEDLAARARAVMAIYQEPPTRRLNRLLRNSASRMSW